MRLLIHRARVPAPCDAIDLTIIAPLIFFICLAEAELGGCRLHSIQIAAPCQNARAQPYFGNVGVPSAIRRTQEDEVGCCARPRQRFVGARWQYGRDKITARNAIDPLTMCASPRVEHQPSICLHPSVNPDGALSVCTACIRRLRSGRRGASFHQQEAPGSFLGGVLRWFCQNQQALLQP